MSNEIRQKKMDSEDLQQGFSKQRKGKIRIVPVKEDKIEVEIRDVVRVYAHDIHLVKKSYEEWSAQWDID